VIQVDILDESELSIQKPNLPLLALIQNPLPSRHHIEDQLAYSRLSQESIEDQLASLW
jgi:hypothetical protein